MFYPHRGRTCPITIRIIVNPGLESAETFDVIQYVYERIWTLKYSLPIELWLKWRVQCLASVLLRPTHEII